MKKPVVIVGIGEVGGVFARGFLKLEHPVYPVTRLMDVEEVANNIPEPQCVIVAVGEKVLSDVLEDLPKVWAQKIVLLQNELLPKDWKNKPIDDPTVISVWFEKKQPKDYKVIIPSPVYGPQADLIAQALAAIKIDCKVLNSEEDLLVELVLKNLYILTTNISGLQVGGNVGELWDQHQSLAKEVANDVLDIQFKLIGQELDRERLIQEMVKAFEGDLEHKCMGRSAPARLERAIAQADVYGLEVQRLRVIAQVQSNVT